MPIGIFSLKILAYSLTLWLGLYLLARNPASARLLWTGLGLLAYSLSVAADILGLYTPITLLPGLSGPLVGLSGLLWLAALLYLWPDAPSRFRWVFALTLGIFMLGLATLFIPPIRLPSVFIHTTLTLDVIIFGLAVAMFDAFDEGQTLLPDLYRSFDYSFIMVFLFGGLVALAIIYGAGLTLPMVALLLATIAAAIATQTWADSVQTALDRLALASFPGLQQARAELRAATSALPRLSTTINFEALDEAEFERLTRRALSQLGDLPRLAASPLTHLPLVEVRLASRGAPDNTLERAAELKAVLTESIARLKPRDQNQFGVSEAWRHYNALYFPYVLGLKPYSRRREANGFDSTTRQALEWFQTQVPERTLHNWQNAAAKLVAQDLRERLGNGD